MEQEHTVGSYFIKLSITLQKSKGATSSCFKTNGKAIDGTYALSDTSHRKQIYCFTLYAYTTDSIAQANNCRWNASLLRSAVKLFYKAISTDQYNCYDVNILYAIAVLLQEEWPSTRDNTTLSTVFVAVPMDLLTNHWGS